MDVPVHEIVAALENDAQIDFKKNTGKTLRGGRCPACGKRELYISTENPYQLKCPRDNNCGYEESTRSRYPHLWEDLTKRVPPTEADPKATAKAFLQGRGFDSGRILNLFTQEIRRLPTIDGGFANVDVVRFALWDGHYWDRIINEKDVRLVGDKARTSKGLTYAGKCWVPPTLTINTGDTIFVTEGIFHALALMFANQKSVAAISSSNFPWELVEQHKGKNITWVIAFDDDDAGHKYALKYRKQLQEKGEAVRLALTGSSQDWDDIYKAGKLDAEFINDSLWRGDVFAASTVSEKAWLLFRKNRRSKHVMEFDKKLYSITLNTDQLYKDFGANGIDGDIADALASDDGYEYFTKNLTSHQISNCLPVFKYCETDKLSGESAYYFEIQNTHGDRQVKLMGGALESPAAFNKALLVYAPGCTFDGEAWQFRILRDKWFNHGIDYVSTVPFIGYDKQSGIYIFPQFAFYQGRLLKINKFGYVTLGNNKLKTTFRNIDIQHNEHFNADWLDDFFKAYHWNGLATLSFWLGSLFAEQVRAMHSSFPFLEMSGLPGTGKSTVIELLWKCVGRDGHEGFDPSKSTQAARAREFIQVANLPIVLMEGDRDKDSKRGAFDYNELKSAFNGRAVRSTGAFTRGAETIAPPFRGTIVIEQNAEVDADKAVIERIVHLNYTKANFTPDGKRLSDVFQKMPIENVCGFLPAALKIEPAILSTFEQQFARIEAAYTANGKLKNTRIIKNHAQIAAFGHALQHLFPTMGKKDKEGKTRADRLELFLEERGIERERRLVEDHPLVEQFWQTYELLENGMQHDASTTLLNHSAKPDEIAINLAHMWKVASEHRFSLPSQSDIKGLLYSSTKYKLVQSNAVVKSGLWGKSIRCWVFSTKKEAK